jgi:hypothetical protein
VANVANSEPRVNPEPKALKVPKDEHRRSPDPLARWDRLDLPVNPSKDPKGSRALHHRYPVHRDRREKPGRLDRVVNRAR